MRADQEARLMKVKERLMASIKTELNAESVTTVELLALLSHTVGACIAMQDQRRMTRDMALDIVFKNIEAGNREAVSSLMTSKGSA